jgi:hypothetical protein
LVWASSIRLSCRRIFATCNQLQGPKEIVIMPAADHGGDHKAYHAKYNPFLEKHLTGE